MNSTILTIRDDDETLVFRAPISYEQIWLVLTRGADDMFVFNNEDIHLLAAMPNTKLVAAVGKM